MKRWKIALSVLIAAALLVLLGLRVYRTYLRAPGPAAPAPVAVIVASPRKESVIDSVGYLGTVRGDRDTELAFRAGGTVTEIRVREGERVAAGQQLARLDLPEVEPRVEQARQQWQRARLEAAHLQDELATDERLYLDGAISRARLDQSHLRQAMAEAAREAARATLVEAEARHDFQWLRAPAAGVIAALHVRTGAYANPGRPAITLASGRRRIEVDVLETDLQKGIGPGGRVWMDGSDGTEHEGVVEAAEWISRPPWRTVRVWLAFPPETLAAYPSGAGLSVRIERGSPADVMTVPVSAIDRRHGGTRILRLQADGTVESVPVTLGARRGERQEVRGALDPGDQIAASGVVRLEPGARVLPVDEEVER